MASYPESIVSLAPSKTRIRQHTSAYVSIRQSAYHTLHSLIGAFGKHAYVSMRQHASACVSIRQSAYHTLHSLTRAFGRHAYVSMRQHTSFGIPYAA